MHEINNSTKLAPPAGAQNIFEVAQDIRNCNSIQSIRDRFVDVVERLGFKLLTCASVHEYNEKFIHRTIFENWPDNIVSQFFDRNLFLHDPIIVRSRSAVLPFYWDFSSYDPESSQHCAILELRRMMAVNSGCCVPVNQLSFSNAKIKFVFFLSGSDIIECPATTLYLQLLCRFSAGQILTMDLDRSGCEHRESRYHKRTLLTEREREVLNWIAAGKSSWEVATILGISEHTVNSHIERSVLKLGAQNRTEAAVIAVMLNEFEGTSP